MSNNKNTEATQPASPAPSPIPSDKVEQLRGALIPDEPVRLREKDGMIHGPRIPLRPEEAAILEDGSGNQPHVKFTDDLKLRYIELLSQYGLKTKCARAVGVCPMTVKNHEKTDPDFEVAVELALEVFRDAIEETVIDRAVHGWLEPIVSAGKVVDYVRKFDNRLLELLVKRHRPEYREKQQVDVNISGGVLVAPAKPTSAEDWKDKYKGLPPDKQPDILDGATPKKQVANTAARS